MKENVRGIWVYISASTEIEVVFFSKKVVKIIEDLTGMKNYL